MEQHLLQSMCTFPGGISKPPYLSCLFSWAALKSSCMFLVICSVFRMTSSVLGRTGLGAVWGSAVSGTEPSPCHTILLCLPFLPDLWPSESGYMWQVLLSCLSASKSQCMCTCWMHELAACVVSYILSGRRLTVRLLPQQAATAHMAAASCYHRVGNYESQRKGQEGEREERSGTARMCCYRAILKPAHPLGYNIECDLTLT